ncbi:MAG: hypothetical protein Q8L79_15070 [Methylobacter sp.]|uniref:hypothetical protein n=1 Tax=Methylobacter sp. TaxID=2051955 RepID=UPI002730EAEB|nr:hypothetical protein [Methylobacter sp.]MDP1666431.1 hypothetical protein [Methylobacter sp.]
MGNQVEREHLKSDLILPWVIVGMMLAMLAAYIIICHILNEQLKQPLPEAQRVLLRTIFYVIAIVTFPLTNLIRHIQLRLNQTMPSSYASHGTVADDCTDAGGTTPWMGEVEQRMEQLPRAMQGAIAEAKIRYLVTIIVSMSLIEVIGIFGLVMFVLGDGFNTLHIFTGLSALGLFLYRPKTDEYSEIIDAISAQKHE